MSSCVVAPIAVIGVACRLPGGVNSLDALWPVLVQGRDVVSSVPASRWDTTRFLHQRRSMPGHTVSISAGVLDNIYAFDPGFFGISRKEAEAMDPQQRLLLELTWEALEDALIPPSSLTGSDTAVFVGAASPDAGTRHADDICATTPYSMTGTNLSIIANRISYIFNFHGPSLTIDTACSSAMYALHQACQTLAAGGAGMAVAGGVNVLLAPFPFVGFSQAHMLSPDGRCKVFDASGNGYVRAEGGGVLLLQPLDAALAQGRRIHAVIRGIACNSDGRTQGIALPSAQAQEALLRKVYDSAGRGPDDLAYLEAHGTGTAAGDPVETAAIGRALGMRRTTPLFIGSVKCNLGHLETASAMAGIMKALLVLREKRIPPQIHISRVNPAIDLKGLNLRIPLRMTRLPRVQGLPLAGVNSFGFGGANGHLLLEAPAPVFRRAPRVHAVPPLFLSTRSEASLRALAGKYAERINDNGGDYYDIAAGAVFGRDALPHRLVVGPSSPEAQVSALRAFAGVTEAAAHNFVQGEAVCPTSSGEGRPLTAFVFSGNGGQWAGMGKALLGNAAFAAQIRKVADLMRPLTGVDMVEVLRTVTPEDMKNTEIAQQLLFLVQTGLCAALEGVGIRADVAFGHSVGEVAAAWYCGGLSLKEAVRVIYYRSFYQGKTLGLGKMAAASISLEEARRLTEAFHDVEVAGINAADAVTLSGSGKSLIQIGEMLQQRRIFFKMLPLEYAFHSARMEGVKEGLLQSLKGLRGHLPRRPFISTVTGAAITEPCGAVYWWRNVREPVNFHNAALTALDMGVRFFLEIGPHSILLRYLRSGLRLGVPEGWVGGTLVRNGDCLHQFQTAWRTAWAHGWPMDMTKHFPVQARPVSLPTYAWDREDCQIAPTPECAGQISGRADHPLLGWRTPTTHQWENVLDLENRPWISDHKVGESVYYPAAAFLEMALAAARLTTVGGGPVELLHTAILRPIIFHEQQPVKLRTVVEATDGEVHIFARPYMSDQAWTLHAKGRMTHANAPVPSANPVVLAPENFGEELAPQEVYRITAAANMHYGPVFQPLAQCWRKGDSILARFASTAAAPQAWEKDMLMPPPLLDGGLQLLFPLIAAWLEKNPAPRLPYWFERCILFQPGRPVFALAQLERASSLNVVCSLDFFDGAGNVLLRLYRGHARTVERLAAPSPSTYVTRIMPQPHPLAGLPQGQPSMAHLTGSLDTYCHSLNHDPHYRRHQSEVLPLRDMAIFALAHELGVGTPTFCPPELVSYLRARLMACGADFVGALPDFTDIWRTLMAEDPGAATFNLLLSNARKTLLENAPSTAPDSPLWGEYYRQEYSVGYNLLHCALEALLVTLPQGQALHVLEVGAATGCFSRRVAPLLEGQWRTITDSDTEVLEKLRLSLKRDGLVEFALWDVEQMPMPDKAHILLAAHCLHKADNIELALRHCRESLHPGGWLLLAERTPNLADNLFLGQEVGWWQSSPAPDQPVSRLLAADQWREAALHAGFAEVYVYRPVEGLAGEHSFVLLARVGMEQGMREVAETPLPRPTSSQAGISHSVAEGLSEEIWLLCEDGAPSAILMDLREQLNASGHTVQRLQPGARLHLQGAVWHLRPDKAEHWRKLWTKLSAQKGKVVCVHAVGLDGEGLDWHSAQNQCASLTQLARGWDMAGRPSAALRLLTRHALSLPDESMPRPAQAAVIGVARVLMNEMPALETRCIDLHRVDSSLPANCRRELLHPTEEREVILDGPRRYVLRSQKEERGRPDVERGNALRLACQSPGRLESLRWLPAVRPQAAPGMVVVSVRAVGLNFRDVMWAMNLLPEEALENGFSGPGLGIECAGVVESVGQGVRDIAPGQRVLCFGPHCFGSHVLTTAQAVAPIPGNWGFAEAASVPVAFFTAWYALRHLADLQPDESLLIHGAAGGVGLAAVQIAAHLGVRVFATAGSEDKRHLLRLLGVEHVYDSRSLGFYDEVWAATRGQGVDAVLNSLAGEGMDQSLRLLKPFGRFLELGKRDFYADSPLRLRPFRNNVSYFGVDVDQLMKERPALGQRLFAEIMGHFVADDWRPLPFTRYGADEVETAFRTMQQSRHVGKIVVEAPLSNYQSVIVDKNVFLPVCWDGSYIISGGLGGFGLATARRLAERGAGTLILLSRRGAQPEHSAALQELRTLGLPQGRERQVLALAQDVADDRSLSAALDKALSGLPPLRGVIHAAAVLDDVTISGLTTQRLGRVLRPKAGGAFALHNYTQDKTLDFFVMYSSATTLLGNPGQANYVAANMVLESLAALRRRLGLPGLAVGWGAIADAGMLARDALALKSLKRVSGIVPLPAAAALTALERLSPCSGPAPAVLTADWKNLSRLPLGHTPRLDLLCPVGDTQESSAFSLRESIKDKSKEDALAYVTEAVTIAVARILRVAVSSLRPRTPLADLGMDSLMAMELGLALEEMLDGQSLSGGLNASVTIHDLAERLYAILCGHGDGQKQLRQTLESSHGISVRDDLAEAALEGGKETGA